MAIALRISYSPLILFYFSDFCKKFLVFVEKGLRVLVSRRRYPFTGGAEVHGGAVRRAYGLRGGQQSEAREAGRAGKIGRIWSILYLAFFDIEDI